MSIVIVAATLIMFLLAGFFGARQASRTRERELLSAGERPAWLQRGLDERVFKDPRLAAGESTWDVALYRGKQRATISPGPGHSLQLVVQIPLPSSSTCSPVDLTEIDSSDPESITLATMNLPLMLSRATHAALSVGTARAATKASFCIEELSVGGEHIDLRASTTSGSFDEISDLIEHLDADISRHERADAHTYSAILADDTEPDWRIWIAATALIRARAKLDSALDRIASSVDDALHIHLLEVAPPTSEDPAHAMWLLTGMITRQADSELQDIYSHYALESHTFEHLGPENQRALLGCIAHHAHDTETLSMALERAHHHDMIIGTELEPIALRAVANATLFDVEQSWCFDFLDRALATHPALTSSPWPAVLRAALANGYMRHPRAFAALTIEPTATCRALFELLLLGKLRDSREEIIALLDAAGSVTERRAVAIIDESSSAFIPAALTLALDTTHVKPSPLIRAALERQARAPRYPALESWLYKEMARELLSDTFLFAPGSDDMVQISAGLLRHNSSVHAQLIRQLRDHPAGFASRSIETRCALLDDIIEAVASGVLLVEHGVVGELMMHMPERARDRLLEMIEVGTHTHIGAVLDLCIDLEMMPRFQLALAAFERCTSNTPHRQLSRWLYINNLDLVLSDGFFFHPDFTHHERVLTPLVKATDRPLDELFERVVTDEHAPTTIDDKRLTIASIFLNATASSDTAFAIYAYCLRELTITTEFSRAHIDDALALRESHKLKPDICLALTAAILDDHEHDDTTRIVETLIDSDLAEWSPTQHELLSGEELVNAHHALFWRALMSACKAARPLRHDILEVCYRGDEHRSRELLITEMETLTPARVGPFMRALEETGIAVHDARFHLIEEVLRRDRGHVAFDKWLWEPNRKHEAQIYFRPTDSARALWLLGLKIAIPWRVRAIAIVLEDPSLPAGAVEPALIENVASISRASRVTAIDWFVKHGSAAAFPAIAQLSEFMGMGYYARDAAYKLAERLGIKDGTLTLSHDAPIEGRLSLSKAQRGRLDMFKKGQT